MDPEKVQYDQGKTKAIQLPQVGEAGLTIKDDPYAKIKIGGKPTITSSNPLIYSGDAVNYIDPRSNQNYYSEDIYSSFEQNAKQKPSTPQWIGTSYNPFESTGQFKYESYQLPQQPEE